MRPYSVPWATRHIKLYCRQTNSPGCSIPQHKRAVATVSQNGVTQFITGQRAGRHQEIIAGPATHGDGGNGQRQCEQQSGYSGQNSAMPCQSSIACKHNTRSSSPSGVDKGGAGDPPPFSPYPQTRKSIRFNCSKFANLTVYCQENN